MGFSGTSGFPDIDSLIRKLAKPSYYKDLFGFVFGDTLITENRIQNSLSQFIRSIQSFDSKFDSGMAQAATINSDFPNFTQEENAGKRLFNKQQTAIDSNGARISGGLGCKGCHNAPEFDINPLSGANGINEKIGGGKDYSVTRAPSLRDIFNRNGNANGPFRHTGLSADIRDVLNHYDSIIVDPADTGISVILKIRGNGQRLRMTNQEKNQVVAFLKTITGNTIYTDSKWSNPFTNDSLITFNQYTSISIKKPNELFKVFPNHTKDRIFISGLGNVRFQIFSVNGKKILEGIYSEGINVSSFNSGIYFINVEGKTIKFVKD